MTATTNIPHPLDELKHFSNWILHAPDKTPFQIDGASKASPTDPNHWATYDDAVAALKYRPQGWGLGFVLTREAGYCVVDLDTYKTQDATLIAEHQAIHSAFNTYSELSPSGKGVHLWMKGQVPQGKKRSDKHFEVFSDGKYCTVTFNPYRNVPIYDQQENLNGFYPHYWPNLQNGFHPEQTEPFTIEILNDEEVLTAIVKSVIGVKFTELYEGRWQGKYPSQSEADQALMNYIWYVSKHDGQAKRLFLNSALGKRDKGKRNDYLNGMVKKAKDKDLPEMKPVGGWYPPNQSTNLAQTPLGKLWPKPLGADAYIGPVGDFVRLVADTTEGDINALVVLFLTAIGNWFGRGAYFSVEDSKLFPNEFAVVVGKSAKARKGTVTDRVTSILERVDAAYSKHCIKSGASTGEGLINAVRDPRTETTAKPSKDTHVFGAIDVYEKLVDHGVKDKRLLDIEGEFAGVLDHMKRQGNVLGTIMRHAWDSKRLQVLAKANKDVCDQPHISLIGNITLAELNARLEINEIYNGFGNRILWCCAQRSKQISKQVPMDEVKRYELVETLQRVAYNLPKNVEIRRDEQAQELWDTEYKRLSQPCDDAKFEGLTSRGDAHVAKLSMIYALLGQTGFLDQTPCLIRVEHLKAALEVWRYCEDSVRFIFGDADSEKLATEVLAKLKVCPQKMMSRTDISRAFSNNKKGEDIQRACELLEQAKLIERTAQSTGGREAIIWKLAEGT